MAARNEARDIGQLLASLRDQSFAEPWEIVVVDNGSRDATADVVRSWCARLPNLRLELVPDAANVAAVRNEGVRRSRSSLLLFCDGDAVVDERWVEAMVAALHDDAIVTGDRDYRRLNAPSATTYLPDRQGASSVGGAPEVYGCNFGVRRSTWDALGGLAEDVPYAEDVDFGLRAARLGIAVAHRPQVLVHRRVPARARDVFRQHYGYGRGQVAIFERHLRDHGRRDDTTWVRELAFLVVRSYWVASRSKRIHWSMVAGRHAGRIVESVRRRVFLP